MLLHTGIKGGYEVSFSNVSYTNVTRPATFKVATAGILNDVDGTLGSGAAGGTLAPYAGHLAANPDCRVGYDTWDVGKGRPHYVMCATTIRRVSLVPTYTSAITAAGLLFMKPKMRFIDVTDWAPSADFDALHRLPYWEVASGPHACVEQEPGPDPYSYLVLLATGREYLFLATDANRIPAIFEGKVYAAKMTPDERIVLHFNHKPPFAAAHAYAEVQQVAMSRWGENGVNIGWEAAPPVLPDYGVGDWDDAACALNEWERCATDELFRQPMIEAGLSLAGGRLAGNLTAAAGGRTIRGWWLRAAAGGAAVASGDAADWVLAESSGTYLEGSRIEFVALAAENYAETRWRHGFDGAHANFRFFEAPAYSKRGWTSGAKNGTMTISNVIAPMYCWDVEHDENTATKRTTARIGANVELWWCEEKDESGFQDWEWIEVSGGYALRNAATRTCAGVDADVAAGAGLVLADCASVASESSYGTLLLDPSWLEETEVAPRHGSFTYDRSRGPAGFDPDAVTWDATATSSFYSRGMIPYDQSNISTMSVLLAGNSTVVIDTHQCGPEGCPYTLPVCRSCGSRSFTWSSGDASLDAANWNVTDDPSVDVPSDYWQGTIWDDWVVTVDGATPVVNRLVVRGTLIFKFDAGTDVTLHAHYVTIDGGQIVMGNASHPIDNATTATLALHGDKCLFGVY